MLAYFLWGLTVPNMAIMPADFTTNVISCFITEVRHYFQLHHYNCDRRQIFHGIPPPTTPGGLESYEGCLCNFTLRCKIDTNLNTTKSIFI